MALSMVSALGYFVSPVPLTRGSWLILSSIRRQRFRQIPREIGIKPVPLSDVAFRCHTDRVRSAVSVSLR